MHFANVYPHHDLLNLAFHQLENIESKVSSNDMNGIYLDCLACFISLGIGMEALVNFCGYKIVLGWNERWPYKKKIEKCCKELGLEFDEVNELLSTLKSLKLLRDSIAHAKPIKKVLEVSNEEEKDRLMDTSWDFMLDPKKVRKYYDAVYAFENLIYDDKRVKETGIFTSSFGSYNE